MKDSTKTALWSAAGLSATILLAWYFSKRKQDRAAQTASNSTSPTTGDGSYTFNIPPLTIPPITAPSIPAAPPAASCCTRCKDDSAMSGGKILQSGNFAQQTFSATQHALTQPQTSQQTAAVQSVMPNGPMIIKQENGGMPLPSPMWWSADPLFRQAFVQAYNQTVQENAAILIGQKRPAIPTLSASAASTSYSSIADKITAAGQVQQARGGHDQRWLSEGQTNSIMLFQRMNIVLHTWMQNFGDSNVPGGSSGIGVPDQSIYTIQ